MCLRLTWAEERDARTDDACRPRVRAHEETCQHDIYLEYIASIWRRRRLRMDDDWRA